MTRLKLYFSYDGGRYHGWQRQKNTAVTVQEVLETKLSQIAGSRLHVVASGRTDAGVHARIQVAHVDVPLKMTGMTELKEGEGLPRLIQALNSLLPSDIRVLRAEKAEPDFNAISEVKKKTYVYFINPNAVQLPELSRKTWHLRFPLNWDDMAEASKYFVGKHDFKAFCAADSGAKTTVRKIHEAKWGRVHYQGLGASIDLMAFRVTGSGFLKQMVRSIVGTLVSVGQGRKPPELIPELLKNGVRKQAGPTAPPQGLWLWDTQY